MSTAGHDILYSLKIPLQLVMSLCKLYMWNLQTTKTGIQLNKFYRSQMFMFNIKSAIVVSCLEGIWAAEVTEAAFIVQTFKVWRTDKKQIAERIS